MSSSGGYTENSNDVWGGSPVPYLRGVCDPGDFTSANPARVWKVSLSGTATTSRLRPYTGDIGAVRRFKNFTRGVSGRLLSVTVVGGTGSRTITGAALRGALGLMDDRVWVNSDRNVTGAIRSRYDVLRCAPGLPRSPRVHVLGGARQRFVRGAIYRNAQADRTVWLFGAIYSEYRRVKDARGPLGLPVAGVKRLVKPADCDRRTCRKARFDRGVVFLKRDVGAHELHGAVLAYFSSHGAIGGHLGFPMSDVVSLSNGGSQATFQGKPGGSPVIVTCGPHGWCSESTPS
jgi:uncharacterized protein with LGFP repeats